MRTYLTLFIVALSSSLVLTPVVRRLAQRFGWVDVPKDERRLHELPIPRVGGVAIFASMVCALSLLLLVNNLVTSSLRFYTQQTIAVLASCTLVFLFGVFDDLVGASPRWKFAAQTAAGILLFFLGGQIHAVNVPVFGAVELPPLASFVLTLVWVVGISNAFNLIDGLDGLASGASLFAALVMLIVSFFMGHTLAIVITLVLAGALIGFLRYNINPASIFLGDSGALFIGFLLAALSLLSSQKASTAVAVAIPLMAFGLPVIDTGFTLARRFISGKPLFEGDREHIHHKLLERGWSQRRVAFVLYGVCALFGMLALLFVSDDGGGKLTGLLLLVTGAAVVLVAGRLRYHEVDEVKASVKRNVIDRRARAANNVAVRRASRALSHACTLGDMLAAVRDMLELGEFAYATVQLGRDDDTEASERLLSREKGDRRLSGVEVRGGIICWEWERGDIRGHDILGSHLFWTLRMPLSTETAAWGYINLYREFGADGLLLDVNYLCTLFQKELARAAERIFSDPAAPVTAGDAGGRSLRTSFGG
jgi:UDP-GlcNAc:undecaprenyl-phosphate/decaprenyl-phosphate GlcNAc-1-phosphate transferase